MTNQSFRFGRFVLDPGARQLRQDGAPVDLNSRYFDALALMVSEQGRLVSKDRFLSEVWKDVPVTDEALTQCIRTLRKQLGDDAARPAYIETVIRHGYRFIAPVERITVETITVETVEAGAPVIPPPIDRTRSPDTRRALRIFTAGTLGAGAAGLSGGLLYGLCAAALPEPATGAASALLVVLCLTLILAVIGGAGVSAGIALTETIRRPLPARALIGGAAGGLIIGALVKLLGLDAFSLLFGRTPGDITGALEGLCLGGATGLGVWLSQRLSPSRSTMYAAAIGALCGAGAGLLISVAGGRLLAGSLILMARHFPDSRLSLATIGHLFGENGFGPLSLMASAMTEGALFGGGVAGALWLSKAIRTAR